MAWADSVTYTKGVRKNATIGDSIVVPSDAVVVMNRFRGKPADSFAPTDATKAMQVLMIPALGDDASLGLSDLIAAINTIRGSMGETATFNDLASALQALLGGASDSFSPSDDFSGVEVFLLVAADDLSANSADLVAASKVIVGGSTPLQYTFGDDVSLGITEIASARLPHLASFGDSESLSDVLAALQTILAVASDTVTCSDVAGALQTLLGLPVDSINITDGINALFVFQVPLTDDQGSNWADLVIISKVNIGGATPINALPFEDVSAGLADVILGKMTHRAIFGDTQEPNLSDLAAGTVPLLLSFGENQAANISDVLAGYTPPTTPAGHNFVSVGAGRPLVSNLSKRFINKIGR